MSKKCCGPKKACPSKISPKQVAPKKAKEHELDKELRTEAEIKLAKHYLNLASQADGNGFFRRTFGFGFMKSKVNTALDNLESTFGMEKADIKSFSTLVK